MAKTINYLRFVNKLFTSTKQHFKEGSSVLKINFVVCSGKSLNQALFVLLICLIINYFHNSFSKLLINHFNAGKSQCKNQGVLFNYLTFDFINHT